MIRSLSIAGYRGFDRFELRGLGRVSLLVGRNNSGKTSILEAVLLLATHCDPRAVYQLMLRRGERVWDRDIGRVELDIRRIFHGHALDVSNRIYLRKDLGDNTCPGCTIGTVERSPKLFLDCGGTEFSITPSGGIAVEDIFDKVGIIPISDDKLSSVKFIGSSSLSVNDVVAGFNKVVLTAQENTVLKALRIIEPSIERLAVVTADHDALNFTPRGGFFVRLEGTEQRVPIGSMGDGLWRILGLTLALAQAKGGVLLVDEIDTGLHYTIMTDMWRLVCETAKELDVQVFATTHNSDCWTSLAHVAEGMDDADVSIQRIELGKTEAVAFTAEEMVIAAERGLEVR